MKIKVPSTTMVDIGELDHKVRLPTASRKLAGMTTQCDACGEEITDEFFIGGFKAGMKNLKLHESCATEEATDGRG